MNILLLSRYGSQGASSRIRFYQYLPYLKSKGCNVTISSFFDNQYLKLLYSNKKKKTLPKIAKFYFKRFLDMHRSDRYDLLWLQYELLPWIPNWIEKLLKEFKIPYIVDYDDAIFHQYDRNSYAIARILLKHKISSVMRNAKLVIAGNHYLGKYALRAGAKRVEYLPSVVDLEDYKTCYKNNKKEFIIGWIGTPKTVKYLEPIFPLFKKFCENKNTTLMLVGASHVNNCNFPINILPWSKNSEVSNIQMFDVGIMPLVDEAWERGKCGYKLIQYMACGKPVIASPVGINKEIVMQNKNGFLAETKDEWINAFNTLYNDDSLCKRMGMFSRERIEKNYCLQVTGPKLYSIINELNNSAGPE